MVFLTGQRVQETKPIEEQPRAATQACTLSCSLAGPTNTPTPTPLARCNNGCSKNADCETGLVCSGSMCRNPSCTGQTDCVCPTPTPTPLASCNNGCSQNSDCVAGLVCSGNACRN